MLAHFGESHPGPFRRGIATERPMAALFLLNAFDVGEKREPVLVRGYWARDVLAQVGRKLARHRYGPPRERRPVRVQVLTCDGSLVLTEALA